MNILIPMTRKILYINFSECTISVYLIIALNYRIIFKLGEK